MQLTPTHEQQGIIECEAYFDFHRYTSETVYEHEYTQEELQEIRQERNKAFKIMNDIEKEMGEPQGRFTI